MKADVFSFARTVRRIAADNRGTGAVPKFRADLIADGLAAQLSQRPSFCEIMARLEASRFKRRRVSIQGPFRRLSGRCRRRNPD
jgi:hypothetical protein